MATFGTVIDLNFFSATVVLIVSVFIKSGLQLGRIIYIDLALDNILFMRIHREKL